MLNRYIEAQKDKYGQALQEVRNGCKQSHWMWFIFPQIKGLGHSSTSRYYAIQDIEEAKEYLAHPILGHRLQEICKELLVLAIGDAHRIFGSPDDLKLRSCMTLFDSVQPGTVFQKVIDKFFNGEKDNRTLSILKSNA